MWPYMECGYWRLTWNNLIWRRLYTHPCLSAKILCGRVPHNAKMAFYSRGSCCSDVDGISGKWDVISQSMDCMQLQSLLTSRCRAQQGFPNCSRRKHCWQDASRCWHRAANVIPGNEGIIPSTANVILVHEGIIPSTANVIPGHEGIIPSTANFIPGHEGIMPSTANDKPSYLFANILVLFSS